MTAFTTKLLRWYQGHQRDLPWRRQNDPYKIWVSEVILQQTRVEQGLPYYQRFIHRFPDVSSLANAPEQDVLKYWQGLGYYSRARNMHAAARQLCNQYGGVLPKTPEALRQIKGIGPYTAAAIASIAFGHPIAAIDGNAYRVLSRYFASSLPIDSSAGRKYFQDLGNQLLGDGPSGDFNQALMDVGAGICTPRQPQCTNCPLIDECRAYSLNIQDAFPVKSKSLQRRERSFHFLWVEDENCVAFEQRQAGDIWQGLYQLPLIEQRPADSKNAWRKTLTKLTDTKATPQLVWHTRHLLTHQNLHIYFYELRLTRQQTQALSNNSIQWVPFNNIAALPVPRPLEQLLQQKGLARQ